MNRLKDESSPYLKQHEANPVDWYPWGEEALQKAYSEDKVILVSIGYSACHWCHVMAHESFENEQIGAIMNRHFVNIKVDREERPDVDAVYMDAIHTMGLRGGWPLNVFLMPDARPFYGGTYFPVEQWKNLILGIQNAFEHERDKLETSAEGFVKSLNTKISDQIGNFDSDGSVSERWNEQELTLLFQRLAANFDLKSGGMMRAPKFPMPSIWFFLLKAQYVKWDEKMIEHLKLTLDKIALGGIYDHVGGGWARYSTDAEWKIPHFEKMLYDNGQLLELYSEAYLFFKKNGIFPENQKLYKWAVEKTVFWLKQEMFNSEGGFYAALDADSEGVEGKYYSWFKKEADVLLKENSEKFCEIYNFKESGNWENGLNVLHLTQIPSVEEWAVLEDGRAVLFEATKKRIKPGLDNKIICSWNGLMLSGLIKAFVAFEDESVLDLILQNALFFKNRFTIRVETIDGDASTGLWHLAGEKKIVAFLDDYAAYIKALCELYQITFDEQWLVLAEDLAKYVLANFYDDEEGLFFYTDVQSEKLIARKKEIYDNVIPASNSLLAAGLIDLGHLMSDDTYLDLGNSMFGRIKNLIENDPSYMANWANVGLMIDKNLPEIAIVGVDALTVLKELRSIVNQPIYFVGTTSESKLPILLDRDKKDGKTYIYVCQNRTCQLPTTSVDDALKYLDGF